MSNLLSIFSIMPELNKDTKPANKFALNNDQTALDDKELKIMEAEFNEKELNEFMTNDNSKQINDANAEVSKTGRKYQNFYALDIGNYLTLSAY